WMAGRLGAVSAGMRHEHTIADARGESSGLSRSDGQAAGARKLFRRDGPSITSGGKSWRVSQGAGPTGPGAADAIRDRVARRVPGRAAKIRCHGGGGFQNGPAVAGRVSSAPPRLEPAASLPFSRGAVR